MASSGILGDFEPTSSSPDLIVDNSGIGVAHEQEKKKFVIRSGYLWKKNAGLATSTTSSSSRFFVLTSASLDYYRNDKCEKLKGSYPLATITSVSAINENASTMKLTFQMESPFLLQAGERAICQEWVHAIQEGIRKWSTNDRDCTYSEVIGDDEMGIIFPSQTFSKKSKLEVELSKIIEVRCGQQTRNFVQFPYFEVEKQSFSLMFEREHGEWSSLMSLDLICDSMLAAQSWKRGLKALIYGDENHPPLRSFQEPQDPIIMYPFDQPIYK
eukprot:gene8775-9713_t